MKKAVILCLLAVTIVSAQQKQRVAVLPSVGDLDPQGLILLTDKVREIATKNLPIENFNILKQDVITKMIGEEELYKSCKEGVCIGDLAKRTNANYGARCDVIKYGSGLVLKFELYSVNEDAIFETFTDYNVKDFQGMLMALEARLPDAFKKMVAARNAEMAQPKSAAPEPVTPSTYIVIFSPNGGSGSVSSQNVKAGNSITLPSGIGLSPNGYTFGGWNTNSSGTGMNYSAGSPYTPAGNVTLYAKWERSETPQSSMPTAHSSGGGGATLIPQSQTSRINRQDLNQIIDRYEKLLEQCAVKKTDRCADVMYTLGSLYYDQGKDDKSLKMYWQLAREYPTFPKLPEAYFQMSVTYLVAGHLDTTRIILEQLVTRFPNNPRVSAAHFHLADLAFMDNNYNKAYDHLKKVKKNKIDLTSWEMTHYRMGECAYKLGDFKKAIEYFRSYVKECDAGRYKKKEFHQMALEYIRLAEQKK